MDNVSDSSLSRRPWLILADGVTYLAGCTDPDYQDSSCPGKGNYTGMLKTASALHRLTTVRSDMGRLGVLQRFL